MMQSHLPMHLFRHAPEAAHHPQTLLSPVFLSMLSAHSPAAASGHLSDPDFLSPDACDTLPGR